MTSESSDTHTPRLDYLWLELTARCNLRCIHCYGGFGEASEQEELSLPEGTRVLQEAYDLGCRTVQFTGGEALLHPSLMDFIRTAGQIGFKFIEVFSNATRIGDQEIQIFQEHQVRLAVSVYSNQEPVHDAITGVPGSFQRTVSALERLKHAGVPFRIAVILMRQNQNALEGMAAWIKDRGAYNAFRVDPIRPAGRGVDPTLQPNEPSPSPPSGRADATFYPGHEFRAAGCTATCWKGKLAVTARGQVLPCIFARDLVCGDLQKDFLETVVTSDAVKELWSITLNDIPECRDCAGRSRCADCRYLAFANSGDLYAKNPRCRKPAVAEHPDGREEAPRGEFAASPPIRSREVVAREIDGEFLLYHPKTKRTHLLNPTASFLWQQLDGRASLEHLSWLFLEHFETSQVHIQQDLKDALFQLSQYELIEWKDVHV